MRHAVCENLQLDNFKQTCEASSTPLRRFIMSETTIRRKAAEIRRSWTRCERLERAAASKRRCIELVLRLVPSSARAMQLAAQSA
jgi:hypothetical protein